MRCRRGVLRVRECVHRQPGRWLGRDDRRQRFEDDSEATPDDDGTYLRAAQIADANGIVQFTTVWPGWYRGGTVHIRLKVHVNKPLTIETTTAGYLGYINLDVGAV